MYRISLCCQSFALFLLMLSSAFSADIADHDRYVLHLSAVEEITRVSALEEMRRERADLSVALVKRMRYLLGTHEGYVDRHGHLHVVLQAVGDLRVCDAAAILIDHIDLKVNGTMETGSDEQLPVDTVFPALHAIIGIGAPSIPHLLHLLQSIDIPVKRRLALVGLVRILHDKRLVHSIIEGTAKTGTIERASRDRLLASLAALKDPTLLVWDPSEPPDPAERR